MDPTNDALHIESLPAADRPRAWREAAGRNLRALREARGLRRGELGVALGGRDPGRAGARVAALEEGRTVPDAATREAIRGVFGDVPDGWDRAVVAELDLAVQTRFERDEACRLLALVLPRLVAAPERMQAAWEGVPIRWPRSGTSITGPLRVTLGALVRGCRPGGPLECSVDGERAWIVAASGSMLSGAGTVHALTADGRWLEANRIGDRGVVHAWKSLARACAEHAAARDGHAAVGAADELAGVAAALGR
jgi:transcriptional regulator with XRE-family HTH domain